MKLFCKLTLTKTSNFLLYLQTKIRWYCKRYLLWLPDLYVFDIVTYSFQVELKKSSSILDFSKWISQNLSDLGRDRSWLASLEPKCSGFCQLYYKSLHIRPGPFLYLVFVNLLVEIHSNQIYLILSSIMFSFWHSPKLTLTGSMFLAVKQSVLPNN